MYTIIMRIKLTKWGNSLGIRLPKIFALQIGMTAGGEVEVDMRDDGIIISKPKESLDEMLRSITPDMLHGESDTGDAVGDEAW
jgi:antitoxin MazE